MAGLTSRIAGLGRHCRLPLFDSSGGFAKKYIEDLDPPRKSIFDIESIHTEEVVSDAQ